MLLGGEGNRHAVAARPEESTPMRKVSIDRWREAQEWELGVWKEAQTRHGWRRFVVPVAQPILAALGSDRGQGDDWNHWWADRFDGYAFLPQDLGDYIELGCGPYTNTRLITRGRTARRVICSDPLVRSYIHFKHRWLAEAYRRGSILIDDHPLEEMPYAPATFDVVVVINVLDHVYDFDLCMTNAVALVRPGGYFVIGQDLSNEHEAETDDLGHPIRVTAEDVEGYLGEFDPLLKKNFSRKEGRNPDHHYSTLIFGGRKGG
jgi:SAM-dependent methyltransferase